MPVNTGGNIVPKARLVGGKDGSSGRLEIQMNPNSFYQPVCTSYWDTHDTKVVCRELGYRLGNFYLTTYTLYTSVIMKSSILKYML